MFTDDSFLSLEEMACLVEEKKSRRNLNIFVLSGAVRNERNLSELSLFFLLLEKNIESALIPSRFQLAIAFPGHWMAVDCYIKKGRLYLFVLDAAVLANLPIVLKNFFSNETKIFSYNGMKIQTDFSHCAFFTLYHVLRLSNRDKHWQDLISMEKNGAADGIIYFDEKECPSSLAFIFKPSQDLDRFQKLAFDLKRKIINKREQTLENAVNSSIKSNPYNSKKINSVILYKAKKYKKRGLYFFNNSKDIVDTTDRTGFQIIGNALGGLFKILLDGDLRKIDLNQFSTIDETIFVENINKIIEIVLAYSNEALFFILQGKGFLDLKKITFDTLLLASRYENSVISYFCFEQVKNDLSEFQLFTLLDESIKNKNNHLLEALLSFGVKTNFAKDNKLPLMTAIDYENKEAFNLLIKYGANLDQPEAESKMTPRRLAACMFFDINESLGEQPPFDLTSLKRSFDA